MRKLYFSVVVFLVLTNPMKIWANDEVSCICLEWTQAFDNFFRYIPPDMAFGHFDEERIAHERAESERESSSVPTNDHDHDRE